MKVISFPTNTKQVIDAMRGAVGRNIVFHTETLTPCTACSINPVTNTSINSFCPTCSGVGYTSQDVDVTISGHITWGSSERPGWYTGGQMPEGDCRVQVEYTTVNENLINSCSYIVVDNRKMDIKKKILRGVPTINRILLDVKERDDNG